MSEVNLYDRLCRVTLNFTIWTGAVAVEDCDYSVGEGGRVPSRKVADRGRKDIVDTKDALGPMNAIKTACRRILDRYGLKEDEAWVIPADLAETVCEELDAKCKEFDQAVQDLVRNFSRKKQEWLDANPEDAEIIARGQAVFDESRLSERFESGFRATRFMPVREEDVKNFNEDAKGVGVKLLFEISEQAKTLLDKYFFGKDRVSASTQKTLIKIRNRVHGLRFLNRAFSPIVDMLDDIIKGYQSNVDKGFLVGPFYFQVMATLLIMSDRQKLKDLVDQKLSPQMLGQQLEGQYAKPAEPEAEAAPVAQTPKVEAVQITPEVSEAADVKPTYEVKAFQLGAAAPQAKVETESEEPVQAAPEPEVETDAETVKVSSLFEAQADEGEDEDEANHLVSNAPQQSKRVSTGPSFM
jgi:hypothetical protein